MNIYGLKADNIYIYILGGDFNLVLNQDLDTKNYKKVNHLK